MVGDMKGHMPVGSHASPGFKVDVKEMSPSTVTPTSKHFSVSYLYLSMPHLTTAYILYEAYKALLKPNTSFIEVTPLSTKNNLTVSSSKEHTTGKEDLVLHRWKFVRYTERQASLTVRSSSSLNQHIKREPP